MKQDYYSILGVSKTDDDAAIKKAYRKLAKKYHPDTHAGDKNAEEKFKEITEAYEILSDPKKRKLYDQFGHAAFDGSMGPDPEKTYQQYQNAGGNGYYRAGDGSGYQEFHFNGNASDMEDLFGDLFGHGFSGFASGNFHGEQQGFGKTRRSKNGFGGTGGFGGANGFAGADGFYGTASSDVTAKIEVDFEDAVFGADKTIQLQDPSGKMQTLQIHIPAGIDTGKKIRLKGKGNPGANGKNGDLYLEVTLRKKAGYERKGNDVYTTAEIPYTTAVFGGEAIVPTLYGNVKCRIPEGAQSGSRIRLRGKGMPVMNRPNSKGDEYVTIQIQVPKHLSEEAKQKLHEYQTVAKIA